MLMFTKVTGKWTDLFSVEMLVYFMSETFLRDRDDDLRGLTRTAAPRWCGSGVRGWGLAGPLRLGPSVGVPRAGCPRRGRGLEHQRL